MKASEVMTRTVISTSPNAKIATAIKQMLKNRISGLPVINGKGKPVGILSEGDLLRRPEIGTERRRLRWLDALFGPHDAAKEYVHSHGRKIKDVMTRNPVTVKESTPLHEVTYLMEHHNIKRVPVDSARQGGRYRKPRKPNTGACKPPPRSAGMQRFAIESLPDSGKTGPIHSTLMLPFAMV